MSTGFLRKDLEQLSKEELIEQLLKFTHQKESLATSDEIFLKIPDTVVETKVSETLEATKVTAESNISTTKNQRKNKPVRAFDMSKYQRRPIALKITYLGWDYMGLASQGIYSAALPLSLKGGKDGLKVANPNDPKQPIVATIEDYLLAALETSKLIVNSKEATLSRCGRTDKGVSGLCQVIVLELRSALTKEALEADPLAVLDELPYLDMINKNLPEDIRVVSWAPVSASFNARFDCTSRSYKYFFTTDGTDLNIDLMQQACDFLVGSHDYRNFCRQDGSKQMTSFTRDIFEARIQPASIGYPGQPTQNNFYELYVRGSGFLWHQIRCIMVILFHIGQSLEEPSLVKQLLDTELIKEKPAYELACPYPLVLFDCTYDPSITWQNNLPCSPLALSRVYRNMYTLWYESLTKTYHYSNMLKVLDSAAGPNGIQEIRKYDQGITPLVLGGGQDTQTRKYTAFLKRPRSASVEVINMKYLQRKESRISQKKTLE